MLSDNEKELIKSWLFETTAINKGDIGWLIDLMDPDIPKDEITTAIKLFLQDKKVKFQTDISILDKNKNDAQVAFEGQINKIDSSKLGK